MKLNNNCPICKSDNIVDLIYHQGNYKCNNCGHLFKKGVFDYLWYIKNDYWYKDDKYTLQIYQKMFFSVFEDFIVNNTSCLEIGSADGDFLYWVKDKIKNIDYNELVDILRVEYTFINNKLIGDLKNICFKKKYQNIFLNDVIEHFDDIFTYMGIIVKLLDKKGRLFIITNNGDSINSHNELIYHQEHLNIFSKKSFDIFISNFSNIKEIFKFNSPQGLSFIVLEKD